jgi:hypothetical protein
LLAAAPLFASAVPGMSSPVFAISPLSSAAGQPPAVAKSALFDNAIQVSPMSLSPAPAPASLASAMVSTLPVDGRSTYTQASVGLANRQQNDELSWISQSELASGQIPAFVSSDFALGIDSPVSIVADLQEHEGQAGNSRSIDLRSGSVLFAPDRATSVTTPHCKIEIARGAVVLVIALEHGIAIYDLDDVRAGSVNISIGDKTISLSPGRHVLLADQYTEDLSDLCPARAIGHRNITVRDTGNGLRAFHSEFSIIQALNAVMPLRQMIGSDQQKCRKIANHILKTASIFSQLTAGGLEFGLLPGGSGEGRPGNSTTVPKKNGKQSGAFILASGFDK